MKQLSAFAALFVRIMTKKTLFSFPQSKFESPIEFYSVFKNFVPPSKYIYALSPKIRVNMTGIFSGLKIENLGKLIQ